MSTPAPRLDLHRAGDRFTTAWDGGQTHHSFSFGPHYDAANTGFGVLLLHDEHLLEAGAGFDPHPHRDLEIVTWVLQGSLAHQDSTGRYGSVGPGRVQRLSAGSGVRHSEQNPNLETLRFVQAWVVPDVPGQPPVYEERDFTAEVLGRGLVPVASGREHLGAVRLGNREVVLLVTRLDPGQTVALPTAPFLHLYVASGAVRVTGAGVLMAGDALRLTGAEGVTVTGVGVEEARNSEVLVWEMHAQLG